MYFDIPKPSGPGLAQQQVCDIGDPVDLTASDETPYAIR
jgi:hypothetical protein